MKKTYINPKMVVVKIQTSQMLAASQEVSVGTSGSADDAESRYFDWDEED